MRIPAVFQWPEGQAACFCADNLVQELKSSHKCLHQLKINGAQRFTANARLGVHQVVLVSTLTIKFPVYSAVSLGIFTSCKCLYILIIMCHFLNVKLHSHTRSKKHKTSNSYIRNNVLHMWMSYRVLTDSESKGVMLI